MVKLNAGKLRIFSPNSGGCFANPIKLQDHYGSKELVLTLLFNKTRNSAFRMKIFQLCQDLKVVIVELILEPIRFSEIVLIILLVYWCMIL
jgi:hypothetical protein